MLRTANELCAVERELNEILGTAFTVNSSEERFKMKPRSTGKDFFRRLHAQKFVETIWEISKANTRPFSLVEISKTTKLSKPTIYMLMHWAKKELGLQTILVGVYAHMSKLSKEAENKFREILA